MLEKIQKKIVDKVWSSEKSTNNARKILGLEKNGEIYLNLRKIINETLFECMEGMVLMVLTPKTSFWYAILGRKNFLA